MSSKRAAGGSGTDLEVANGEVRLATTDFGGSGPDLLLLPGLGSKRRGFAKLVEHLAGWRVITMDLRGHGDSSTAAFDLPAVVSDVDAVIQRYALDAPYVGGHSLGGMVALQHAIAGHPVAGVINIDGWGPGIAERHIGEDVEEVRAYLDQLADHGMPSRLIRMLVAATRHGREGTTQAVFRLLRHVDVVAWHRDAPCPSLAFNATASTGGVVSALMGRDIVRYGEAHRRGLSRDLAALAGEEPKVTVVEVPDAKHMVHVTHPAVVSAAIDSFHGSIAR